ncbi:hypothetical protein [Paractinoplanes lichenicola]|uniref:Uncharacterized protein n=1 Tax=Paractinoplanes lichenicola TaxID=2802976 RepID=A0ABS1VZH8_9ACTN|nr:hypothetical protein [Actinoplanes lichenicola]MBL7259898.1 hypothetical protein [Actinoplanes lichenicola]
MTTLTEERVSDIRRRVTFAEQDAAARHAGFAEAIHQSFDQLRVGLERAHATCGRVDETDWASYVTGLDRGLDELQLELTHAADVPTAEGRLLVKASKLELAGWRLRFSLPGAGDAEGVRERLSAAESEVDAYAAGSSTPEAVRGHLETLHRH